MLLFLCILAYLILVLIRPQDYPVMDGTGIPFLPIALLAALVAWIASSNKRFDAPQYLLLVLFLAATSFSVLASGWSGGALEQLTSFAPVVLSFVLLANAVDSPGKTVAAMAVFVLCALVLAVHGSGQAAQGTGWTGMPLVDDGRIQYVGIFSDPNDLGLLFVVCIPMALYLSARGGLMGLRRIFWLATAGYLVYGVYLTNSRGAMLALVAMTGAYLWVRRGPLSALLLCAGSLVVLRMMPSRLSDLDVQESSAMGRVDAWYEGIQMLIANPFFGVGTDRFIEYHHLTAHNSLILVLAENGFIGFTIWFAFVGYCFWMMARVLGHQPGAAIAGDGDGDGDSGEGDDECFIDEDEMQEAWRAEQAISLTLLISLTGFFAAAFFLSRSYVILLYLLAAVVVAHYSGVRERFPSLPAFDLRQDLVRWPLLAGVATVGFYVVLKVLLAIG